MNAGTSNKRRGRSFQILTMYKRRLFEPGPEVRRLIEKIRYVFFAAQNMVYTNLIVVWRT